jgi:hypothetical protein
MSEKERYRKRKSEKERHRKESLDVPIFRERIGLKRLQRTDYNENEILRF